MTMEHGEDCCVKVAVHVRPLIGDEKLQGCKDCVAVVPGKPQVQIGSHSFTFDHVYGSTGTPSAAMFDQCVAPLVDGLFQGYNATVLAYGQVGVNLLLRRRRRRRAPRTPSGLPQSFGSHPMCH